MKILSESETNLPNNEYVMKMFLNVFLNNIYILLFLGKGSPVRQNWGYIYIVEYNEYLKYMYLKQI